MHGGLIHREVTGLHEPQDGVHEREQRSSFALGGGEGVDQRQRTDAGVEGGGACPSKLMRDGRASIRFNLE